MRPNIQAGNLTFDKETLPMKPRPPSPVRSRKRAKGGEVRARGVLDAIHRERFGRSLHDAKPLNPPQGGRWPELPPEKRWRE